MNLMSLLFSFSGRINRAKYWLAVLIYVILWIIIAGLIYLAVFPSLMLIYVILVVVYIPVLISSIAVGIKRLHDRDKSGWWLLLFYLVPSLLGGVSNAFAEPVVQGIFGLASLAISIWAFVELGCLRGTRGPNRYGPDPLPAA